jgi:hypothetical protein
MQKKIWVTITLALVLMASLGEKPSVEEVKDAVNIGLPKIEEFVKSRII